MEAVTKKVGYDPQAEPRFVPTEPHYRHPHAHRHLLGVGKGYIEHDHFHRHHAGSPHRHVEAKGFA